MADVGVAERTEVIHDGPEPLLRLMTAVQKAFPDLLTPEETDQIFEFAADGLELVPGMLQTFLGDHGIQLSFLEARLDEAGVSLLL